MEQARSAGPTSDEHFTVDRTLLGTWGSLKGFQPKDGKNNTPPEDPGNPTVDFSQPVTADSLMTSTPFSHGYADR